MVEPPGVWSDRLSAKDREVGPRSVQDTCETIISPDQQGAQYIKGGDGPVVDWWVYEDVLRPIPQVVACAGFPPESFTLAPIPYDGDAARVLRRRRRASPTWTSTATERRCASRSSRASAGRLFLEAKRQGPRAAVRRRRTTTGWSTSGAATAAAGSSRSGSCRCGTPCSPPPRSGATPPAACTRSRFTELPTNLGLPSIHRADRYWDPLFAACDETGTVICMHIGSGSKMPTTIARRAAGCRRRAHLDQRADVDVGLAALRRRSAASRT